MDFNKRKKAILSSSLISFLFCLWGWFVMMEPPTKQVFQVAGVKKYVTQLLKYLKFLQFIVIFSSHHHRRSIFLRTLCVFTFLFYKHLLLFFSWRNEILFLRCLQFRLFCCFYSVDFVYFWHYRKVFFVYYLRLCLSIFVCSCILKILRRTSHVYTRMSVCLFERLVQYAKMMKYYFHSFTFLFLLQGFWGFGC